MIALIVTARPSWGAGDVNNMILYFSFISISYSQQGHLVGWGWGGAAHCSGDLQQGSPGETSISRGQFGRVMKITGTLCYTL